MGVLYYNNRNGEGVDVGVIRLKWKTICKPFRQQREKRVLKESIL